MHDICNVYSIYKLEICIYYMETRRSVFIVAKIIKALGMSADSILRDFGARLRIQKVAYLIQAMGLAGLNYDFNMYYRGPYSKDLADDYMRLAKLGDYAIETLAEKASFDVPRPLVDADTETLEAASTIYMIYEDYQKYYGAGLNDALKHFRWLKPELTHKEKEALALLKQLKLINE